MWRIRLMWLLISYRMVDGDVAESDSGSSVVEEVKWVVVELTQLGLFRLWQWIPAFVQRQATIFCRS